MSPTDVQKFIAKYGLAAHLAILAVAPLFLFPFAGESRIAIVLLWLSLPAGVWLLLGPSVRMGEHLQDARRRVAKTIVRDPLFWVTIALVVFTGLRALNTGIALVYDAEVAKWCLSEAAIPVIPGSCGDAGFLPFSAAVAFMVLIQGVRHAIGRSARYALLFFASALSGLAAVIAIVATFYGNLGALSALELNEGAHMFAGLAFGLNLIAGTVALVAAFEYNWKIAMLFLSLSIGGNAAGLFSFSPVYLTFGTMSLEIVLLVYSLFYVRNSLKNSIKFKLLVVLAVSFTLGGLLVAALLPQGAFHERLVEIRGLYPFPVRYWEKRAVLSVTAMKSWFSCLWAGTGVASFPLAFRFNMQPADWVLFPRGAMGSWNGWWQALAERGLIGLAFLALPFVFLFVVYVRRLISGVRTLELPHPACLSALLGFSLFVAAGFFDCSMIRTEALLMTGMLLAVAAASFPKPKRRGWKNG